MSTSPPPNPPPAQPPSPPPAVDNPTSPTTTTTAASAAAPPPLPSTFTPIFTLIHSSAHGSEETHHPTIHYLFTTDADADESVTEAALRSLHPLSTNNTSNNDSGEAEDGHVASVLPPPRPGVEERYIVLDVSASGTEVVRARSMSARWQVLDVEVGRAPTWGAADAGDGEGEGGLMVRIKGVEAGGREVDGGGDGDLEGLCAVFERRMGELRRVVEELDGNGEGEEGS